MGLAICRFIRSQEILVHWNHRIHYKNNQLISDLLLTSSVRMAGPQVTFCSPWQLTGQVQLNFFFHPCSQELMESSLQVASLCSLPRKWIRSHGRETTTESCAGYGPEHIHYLHGSNFCSSCHQEFLLDIMYLYFTKLLPSVVFNSKYRLAGRSAGRIQHLTSIHIKCNIITYSPPSLHLQPAS